MTKTQWATLVAIFGYLYWEFGFLTDWKAELSGPPIRVDLVIIYPILIILMGFSVFQLIRK